MWFYADSKMAGTPKPISPLLGGSPKPMVMTPKVVSPKLIGRPPATMTVKFPVSPKPMMTTPKPISPVLVKPPTMGTPKPMMTMPVSPKPVMTMPVSPKLTPKPTITMPVSPKLTPKPVMPIKKPISPLPNMPTRMVSVPKVKYVLNQKPVVFEKVCKQVSFEKVPVQYEFEKQVFPVKVVKKQGMCKSPCMKGKLSPKMGRGHGGSPKLQELLLKIKDKMSPGKEVVSEKLKMKFSPKHKHHHHKHHGSPNMFKIPCAMKTSWHLNRSPCQKESFQHPGSAKSCGSQSQSPKLCGGGCGGNFPRWASSYVPQKASPCMTAMTTNCNKKFCSQC